MKLVKTLLAGAFLLPLAMPAMAQTTPSLATVVATCGTPPSTYTAGQQRPVTQNTSGLSCGSSSGSVSGTVTANQGTAGASAWPVATTPTQRTLVALDVATVTTGGTAVTALTAGHRTAGGFLNNPKAATVDLCINEIATASGTTSAGSLTCIAPGQSYTLAPASTAVSVITSDSSHPFSGYGLN